MRLSSVYDTLTLAIYLAKKGPNASPPLPSFSSRLSLSLCMIICKQPAAKRLRFLRRRRPQGRGASQADGLHYIGSRFATLAL